MADKSQHVIGNGIVQKKEKRTIVEANKVVRREKAEKEGGSECGDTSGRRKDKAGA